MRMRLEYKTETNGMHVVNEQSVTGTGYEVINDDP